MVFGLLPLFLTGQLGASRTLLGLVEGTAEMLGYTVRMTSGTVSDRVQKRKPLVLIGYSLSAASKPFFALAGGWADVYLPCGRQTGSARGSGLLPAMRSLASQCTRARSAARSGCIARWIRLAP